MPEYKVRAGFPVQLALKNGEQNKLNPIGEKFKTCLQEYLETEEKSTHLTVIKTFFKNPDVQKMIAGRIVAGDVIIDRFPDDNSQITNLLNVLLKGRSNNGSLYQKTKDFFESNNLAVGLRWIPSDYRNKKSTKNSVELIKKSPSEVKQDIKNLGGVTQFIGRYVATIKMDNRKLTFDENSNDIRVLQTHLFKQKEIFVNEIALPKYSDKGILGSAKHAMKNTGQFLQGRPNVDNYFGRPEKKMSETLASIINKFEEKLKNKPNRDHIIASSEYKLTFQKLNNLSELVNQYEELINTKAIEKKNNIDLSLRYALASELVKIKQGAKAVNMKKSFMIFTAANVAFAASLGVSILAAAGAILIPLIAAAALIFVIQFIIFKKVKPQIQRTELSDLVRDSIKEDTVQHGSRLSSHEITWRRAIVEHWQTPVLSKILTLFSSKSAFAKEAAE